MDIFRSLATSNHVAGETADAVTSGKTYLNGGKMGASIGQGKVVAGIALPKAPAIKIKFR